MDDHNKEVYTIKEDIKIRLTKLEESGVNYINANGGRIEPKNELVRTMTHAYRAEVKRSNQQREETNFIQIIDVLQTFADNVTAYFQDNGYDENLAQITNTAALILIDLNSIKQKGDQLDSQLAVVITMIKTAENNSVRERLNDIANLIGENLHVITIDQLRQ